MASLMQVYPPINLYDEKLRKLAMEFAPVWVRDNYPDTLIVGLCSTEGVLGDAEKVYKLSADKLRATIMKLNGKSKVQIYY